MTTVFHPFALQEVAPGTAWDLVRPDDQAPCWRGLDAIGQAGYRVIHWPCRGLHDYAAGLCQVWRTDSILVVEHDMGITLEHVRSMDECAAGICAYAYRIEHDTGEVQWSHRQSRGYPMVYGEEGDEWATVNAMGCTLIHRKVQDLIEPAPTMLFYAIDAYLGDQWRARGMRVHMHWPEIAHHHAKSGQKGGVVAPEEAAA